MTIDELYRQVSNCLKESGIDTYMLDARLIIEHFLGIDTTSFFAKKLENVSTSDCDKILKATKKRSKHYPLQYITNEQEFMGFDFYVNENVLIPRAETELLVEKIVKLCNEDNKKSVLDMCTGQGAIAISISKLCKLERIVAVDISDKALEVAKINAKKNKVDISFIQGDLFENVSDKYDIIVSNPPYIKSKDIEGLMEEVRDYEPIIALDGYEDGLYFYKEIIKKAGNFLNDKAYICFEIGYDQASSVKKLLQAENYSNINVYKDYAGLDRIVIAQKL